ncbi:CHAT domain-containing protein [Saccharothrix deserti]|uniref:CHAT domain-containing protein n=1 Tax=Saccharothrix deserti TaxID=2593674 RepID=UPI00131C065F|nr:CHAT domain-containing protein [Saccharothrix deserti]
MVDFDDLMARASSAVDRHELAEAERLLDVLLAVEAPDAARRGRVLVEWAWVRGARGDHDDAERGFTEAVVLAEREGLTSLECEALRELAIVVRYQADFVRADALLERAVRKAAAIGNALEEGQALFGRATIAHHQDRFAHARNMLLAARRAAEAHRAAGGAPEQVELLLANICREEAVSARIARDYDTARALLAEARSRYAALDRRVGVANTARELGAVLEQVGDEEGARAHYGEAFVAYLRAGRRLGAAAVARRLGYRDVVAGTREPALFNRAVKRLEQARRLGAGEPTNHVAATRLLAQVARLQGRFEDAEAMLDEVRDVLSVGGEPDRPHRALSAVALERGFLARDRGLPDEALANFTEALDLLDHEADRGAASIAHHQVALQLAAAGRLADALPHAVAGFQLDEDDGRQLADPTHRRSFYVDNNAAYALAMRCAVGVGDGRTALTVATAARAEALAAFVRAGARLSPDLRDLVTRITLTTVEGDPDGSLPVLYRELEHTTSTQMRQALGGTAPDEGEILASLPEGGHALLVDVFEDDVTVCTRVWLKAGREPVVDSVRLPDSVHELIDRYARAAVDAGWGHQVDALAELGAAVVPEALAAELLAAPSPPPLVVSTGSLLGPVPVGAARLGDRVLAELTHLTLVPSFPLWVSLRSRPRRAGEGVLAFIDPELPGSARERRALTDALAPVRFTTATQLRDALADADRFSAVVIGAHGTPPALDPGAYIDGTARAGLAQALSLSATDQLTAAELLTASLPDGFITASCWSGRVVPLAATEPFGLPTAALLAGAQWVLAGTVDVGGVTGARVMAAFYRHLRDLPPAEALHRAQVEYLARKPDAPPSAWASLCVIGDGYAPATTQGECC